MDLTGDPVSPSDPFVQFRALRMVHIRLITKLWRTQLMQMEQTAFALFQNQNLDGISDLLTQKQHLQRRLQRVEGFIHEWQA